MRTFRRGGDKKCNLFLQGKRDFFLGEEGSSWTVGLLGVLLASPVIHFIVPVKQDVLINRCHKQYIGETKRQLKDRFNKHCRPVDKQTNIFKPTAVSEHFLSNNHTASDMQLIPLELVKTNRDGERKAREVYLI